MDRPRAWACVVRSAAQAALGLLLVAFWDNLREGAAAFDRSGLPPTVGVAPDGGYEFAGAPLHGAAGF